MKSKSLISENILASILMFLRQPILSWIAYKHGIFDGKEDPEADKIAYEYLKIMERQRANLERICKMDATFPPCKDYILGKYNTMPESTWSPGLKKLMAADKAKSRSKSKINRKK